MLYEVITFNFKTIKTFSMKPKLHIRFTTILILFSVFLVSCDEDNVKSPDQSVNLTVEVDDAGVITSYSIHYTKLYEATQAHAGQRAGGRGGRSPPPLGRQAQAGHPAPALCPLGRPERDRIGRGLCRSVRGIP